MDVVEKEPEVEAVKFNIGELLSEARENQNLSAADIARKLNLMPGVVEKIEANQFEQDIPLAFIRGYVRSYAQVVGLDINTICEEFDSQTTKEEAPVQKIERISSFSSRRKEINSSNKTFKIVTYLIVSSLIFLAGWEAWKRFSPKLLGEKTESPANVIELSPSLTNDVESGVSELDTTQESGELSDNGQSAPAIVDEETNPETFSLQSSAQDELQSDKTSEQESVVDAFGKETDQTASQAESNDNVESASANLAGQTNADSDESSTSSLAEETESVNLKTEPVITAVFTFSGDCWVEIRDANGEVLANGIKKDGKVMPLKGVAPFSVQLGEPSVVSLTLNDESYDLSRFPAGRKAAFELE
ncbi:RodZ domain-containing protein [Aliikangiella sp. G2MR2-5]|uniref:RodZ domain-containing protein n=1 Tax=Aliikangiella sp. G2MR2-5 TaxID=2788943 RepID=UPI0018ABEB47|nr:RodZ domain-containing protein [Aliikangiella sp. G2MR2-5]